MSSDSHNRTRSPIENTHNVPHNFINSRYEAINELPREGYFIANCIDLNPAVCHDCVHKGIFTKVTTFSVRGERSWVYRLTDDCKQYLEGYSPSRSTMPCGHYSGFTNERGTEYLQCNHCGGRFTNKEVKDQR